MSDSKDSLDLHAITEEGNIRLRHRVRLLEAGIRDLLDELADEGVDTVNHPARALVGR